MPEKLRKAGVRKRADTPRKNKKTEQKGQRLGDDIRNLTFGLVKRMLLRAKTIPFGARNVCFCNARNPYRQHTDKQRLTFSYPFTFQLRQEGRPP